MATATMDDEAFREFRKFGFSEKTAAKMAALLADCEADHESAPCATAREVADHDSAPAAFAMEREARIYRVLYDDTSFGEFLRDAVATFKVGGAEIKKMFTGKPWNGWVLYQSVMISLLMVAMPALFVFMIYLWVAL